MKIFTLNLLTFLAFNFVIAQEKSFDYVEQHYVDYFSLNRETIFTQLNKTKFLKTEELWFKSYIYNTKTQKPNLTTTNVYVSIYNQENDLIEKKLFYAEDGMTNGNFKLSDYSPGIYHIKTSTNFNRNFKEQHYSLVQFEVMGENEQKHQNQNLSNTEYDLQFLPEGGHLLGNTNNTIGYKIINKEGNSIIIDSANIYNNNGDKISSFKSNEFGIGKFSLFIDPNDTYKVEAILANGDIVKRIIPKADLMGLTLNANNLNASNLFISLQTNEQTLPSLLNKTYYLIIHRDGLLKKINIDFEENKLNYVIPVPKKDLYSGMNIITVFNDEKKPILERLVFNYSPELIGNINLLNTKTKVDSTIIRLRTNLKDSVNKNISVSVLPTNTKSYTAEENIISSFFLNPYINGYVENPSYYFYDFDRKKSIDLDLLLITQGWSRYSWHNIFNSPPKRMHHFEAGMQIKGKLNGSSNSKKAKEIVLYSKESELMLASPLDTENYFSFENIFLIDSTSLFFSLKDDKGNITKPNVYVNIYPNYIADKLNYKIPIKQKTEPNQTIFDETFSFDNTTILDTVSIQNNVIQKPKNKIIRGAFNSNKINIKDRYDPFSVVTDVIRDNGFDIINTGAEVQILSRRATGFSGRTKPSIYVDNRLLSESELFELTQLRLELVDEIFISKTSAAGYGGRGGNINIFTKKGYRSSKQKLTFSQNMVSFGFSLPDEYYSPYYNKTQYVTFSNYGVLNWLPNLSMSNDGIFEFKIPNYRYEDISLFIEGMGSDGSLISKVITVKIE